MDTTSQTATAVLAEYSQRVAQSTGEVVEGLITAMTAAEITKRRETLKTAMDKLKSLKSDINKIKPTNTTYTVIPGQAAKPYIPANGDQPAVEAVPAVAEQQIPNETWDKKDLEAKAKLIEKRGKLDAAVTKYLSGAPTGYEDLVKDLAKAGGKDD